MFHVAYLVPSYSALGRKERMTNEKESRMQSGNPLRAGSLIAIHMRVDAATDAQISPRGASEASERNLENWLQ
jgi:hypothetical protein